MPPHKFIALIGLRCSGKTSVGRELARMLRMPFVDLDREIERVYALKHEARMSEVRLSEVRLSEAHTSGERTSDEHAIEEHASDQRTSDEHPSNARTNDIAARDTRPTDSRATDTRTKTNDARTNDLRPTNSRASSAPAHDTSSSDKQRNAPRQIAPPTPATAARAPIFQSPTAGEILQSQGEPAFRALESEALSEILGRETSCVLATGGGVVEREENRRELALHALCIWLRVDAAELARRLRADPTPRPSLSGEDAASEIPKLALRRDPFYAALAHTTLDGTHLPPAALAEKLARELIARKDLGLQG